MKKIWKLTNVGVVPIVVGALGIVSNNLKDWLGKIDLKIISVVARSIMKL